MCCGEERQGYHSWRVVHGGHHKSMAQGMSGCSCGERKFLTKKERIEMLEEYSESLKCELEGVEEELKEIRGE